MALDLTYIEQLVASILAAAPAIESGIADATPYIEAIAALVKNGGEPTQSDWDALHARLDAGSAALDDVANEPS